MAQNNKTSILLVDDEEGIRVLFKFLLEDFGHHVLTANNGEEAWELLTNKDNSFHVMITDLHMPGSSGEDLVKKIFREMDAAQSPKIIVATGGKLNHSEELEEEFKQMVDFFIYKPFNEEAVKNAITSVLKKS